MMSVKLVRYLTFTFEYLNIKPAQHSDIQLITLTDRHGLTTLNKPKSREVSTNDGIITQNIFNTAVPTSIETK